MKLSTLNKGLILHMPLSQSSFNPATHRFTDKTGYCYHGTGSGTQLGASGSFSTDHQGNSNLSTDFNGSDDKIVLTEDNAFDLEELTLAFWINPDTYDSMDLISKRTTNVESPWVTYFEGGGSHRIIWNFYDTNGSWKEQPVCTLATSEWVHVVVTMDGSMNYKSYKNGAITANSTTYSYFGAANAQGVAIGYCGAWGYLNGKLSDVRVYNRALSAGEALLLYDSYKPQTKISTGGQTLLITP